MNSPVPLDEPSGFAVVAPPRELDATVAPAVQAQFLAALAQARRLAVDLTDVSFIDSTGLTALVVARNHARTTGGEVVLVGVQPQVRRVLQITRLDALFPTLAGIAELPRAT